MSGGRKKHAQRAVTSTQRRSQEQDRVAEGPGGRLSSERQRAAARQLDNKSKATSVEAMCKYREAKEAAALKESASPLRTPSFELVAVDALLADCLDMLP